MIRVTQWLQRYFLYYHFFWLFLFYFSAQGRLFTCLSNVRQNLMLTSLLWRESFWGRTSKQNTTNPTLYAFWPSAEPTVTSTFLPPTSLTSPLRISLKVLDTVYRKVKKHKTYPAVGCMPYLYSKPSSMACDMTWAWEKASAITQIIKVI